MRYKNWLLFLVIFSVTSLVAGKRIYLGKPNYHSRPIENSVCVSMCDNVKKCSDEHSVLQVREKSQEIETACMVLCKKKHPVFSKCKTNVSCNELLQCMYTTSGL